MNRWLNSSFIRTPWQIGIVGMTLTVCSYFCEVLRLLQEEVFSMDSVLGLIKLWGTGMVVGIVLC